MASEVHLLRFSQGHPEHIRADAVRALADPYVIDHSDGVASIQTSDGGADFLGYGEDGGLAVVRASGLEIWDLVIAIAQVTGAAILPVGGHPLVVDEATMGELPIEVQAETRLVTTGEELLTALTT